MEANAGGISLKRKTPCTSLTFKLVVIKYLACENGYINYTYNSIFTRILLCLFHFSKHCCLTDMLSRVSVI